MPRVTISKDRGPSSWGINLCLFDPYPLGGTEVRTTRISTTQGDIWVDIRTWTRAHLGVESSFRGRIVRIAHDMPWLDAGIEVYGEWDPYMREGWIANWLEPGMPYGKQGLAPEIDDRVVTLVLTGPEVASDINNKQLPGHRVPGLTGKIIGAEAFGFGGLWFWQVKYDGRRLQDDGSFGFYKSDEILPFSRAYTVQPGHLKPVPQPSTF